MERDSYKIVGDQNEAVGRLVAGLPRVEAPSDFEMRVRARIASGRTAGTSWRTPLSRVAVPAALLLAIGGYFGYFAFYQNAPYATPEIVTSPESRPLPSEPEPGPGDHVAAAPDTVPEPRAAERTNGSDRQPSAPRRSGTDDGIDTAESAVRQPQTFSQPGRANQAVQNLNPAEGGPGISPKDVFDTLGLRATFSSSAWKVGSVTPKSLADKAGVKAGDIIEALNDQPLTEKTVLGRTFTGTSMRVRRGGQIIEIDLKP